MDFPRNRGQADERTGIAGDAAQARAWLGLSILVLVLAGAFALAPLLGRMPPLDRLVADPRWFRRCLVVHVDLAIVLWIWSFLAALLLLLPARTRAPWTRAALPLAAAGLAAILGAALLPGVEPVLANYVPMLDHGLFALGLCAFGTGVLLVVLSRAVLPRRDEDVAGRWLPVPAAALVGLRATALALLLAGLTFLLSRLAMPSGLGPQAHYELLVWGGGHVLQLASVCGMVSAWLILTGSVAGRAPARRGTATALLALLLLPWLAAPLLAVDGTWTVAYREGFTALMRYCLLPVALVFAGLCVRALLHARRRDPGSVRLLDPRVAGLCASLSLTLLGLLLGALIRGPDTMVPAHYHASIGAVTVAFMGAAHPMLAALGAPALDGRARRLAGLQPWLFGGGQAVFALGFALAGAGGMARKVYGAEQQARGALETVGLVVMGAGGLVAVGGGLLFLILAARAWRAATRHAQVRLSPAAAVALGASGPLTSIDP